MKGLIPTLCLLLLLTITGTACNAQGSSGFHVVRTYHIASAGGWDYIAVGPGNNRLYVSHASQVNILNENTGDSVGVIPNTTGVHGIAFIPALNKGYTSNGRLNNISVFDLKTNEVLHQLATGKNPDAIMYEPFSKTIITCNGSSHDLSIIDAATEKLVATVDVGGKPETAVSDEAGYLFVNIEDKNELAVVNMKTYQVEKHWSLAPAEGPTGLAIDLATKKLFVGCDKLLMVIDAVSGKIADKISIGDGCDGVAFDNKTKNIFASCGEGTLAIIHEAGNGKFETVGKVATKRTARTIAVNEVTHTVYLPAAEVSAPAAGETRGRMIPGTFQVLVLQQ